MSFPDRLQSVLSRLMPVRDLPLNKRCEILANKMNYPDPGDEIIRKHLITLGAPQLVEYLVWIPYKRFTNIRMLGRGGFATVWRGTVRALDERGIILPEYRADIMTDGNPRVRYGEGVRPNVAQDLALKELSRSMIPELALQTYTTFHTTNCTAHILGITQREDDSQYFLVMEEAKNGSLDSPIDEWMHSWHLTAHFCLNLSQALYKLHQLGFMHCDLHPGNTVFFSAALAIIDVGLAKAVEDMQTDDGFYGRLAYLPPEAFENGVYTMASDVYCLGTLMWQLVTRVPPRGTASDAVQTHPHRLREDLVPDAPDEYTNILKDCWNPDPEKRPTAEQVFRRLEAWRDAGFVGEYSLVTEHFIAERRTAHKRELAAERADESTFASVESRPTAMWSVPARAQTSRFYSRAQLKQISKR